MSDIDVNVVNEDLEARPRRRRRTRVSSVPPVRRTERRERASRPVPDIAGSGRHRTDRGSQPGDPPPGSATPAAHETQEPQQANLGESDLDTDFPDFHDDTAAFGHPSGTSAQAQPRAQSHAQRRHNEELNYKVLRTAYSQTVQDISFQDRRRGHFGLLRTALLSRIEACIQSACCPNCCMPSSACGDPVLRRQVLYVSTYAVVKVDVPIWQCSR